ncbi:MAG: hypothetical protein QG602_3680, partial [Verrucomicrobiota bacterium]|nr:hypothetical protein [Verrucomicrobiota bacterium]
MPRLPPPARVRFFPARTSNSISPMPHDLLSLADFEPPMGDLFTNRRLDAGRAVWTRPLPGEADVPKKRIIHQRVVRLHGPARLHRLGVRRGQGYHKCGSR